MLRLLSTIIGQPVVSQHDGGPVGRITAAVFDAAKGKVVAYGVHGAAPFLATVDVLAYLDHGVVVSDQSVLQAEEDLARLTRLGPNRTDLIGSKVVTDQDRKLGRVDDVLIDTEGCFINRIHVRPGIWRRLFTDSLIIPRESVVRITAQEVTVRYDRKSRTAGAEPEVVS